MVIQKYFGPAGLLAAAVPHYEPRPQQETMAVAVETAFRGSQRLLVEAGTGAGKSLAYLIPAILWAVAQRKRVIVSTYTRALQEQLITKDLPLIARVLEVPFRWALVMGAEHYLCRQRLARAQEEGPRLFDGPAHLTQLRRLTEWMQQGGSGLRSDLPFDVLPDVWGKVCRDPGVCLGRRGPFWEVCSYRLAQEHARSAQLVVVNHALFFANLAAAGRILPAYDGVIFDEAHMLEEAAAAHAGCEISNFAIQRLLDEIGNEETGQGVAFRLSPRKGWQDAVVRQVRSAHQAAQALFFDLARCLLADEAASGQLPRVSGAAVRRLREPGLLANPLAAPLGALTALLLEARATATTAERAQELTAYAGRCQELCGKLTGVLRQDWPGYVYWAEFGGGRRGERLTLQARPIEVGPTLQASLFSHNLPLIFTSATLTVGDSFAYVRARLGIPEASERSLASPFEYDRQALLYIPAEGPPPTKGASEAYRLAVERECRELLKITRGGSFILFTSHHLLQATYDALSVDPDLRDLRFFKQGAAPSARLLKEFRACRNGVLFGATTYWQGVDVAGEALRCVILTRLPFQVPDHPLAEARQEAILAKGGNPFVEYTLPDAILTFRQGFGRLIRTRRDRGVVAILDPRLRTKSYGALFLSSLPRCRIVHSLEAVRAMFSRERVPS